jgi:hypothetical protein
VPYKDTEERAKRKRERERRQRNIKAGRHPRETMIEVAVAPLRERFLELHCRGEATATEVALSLGWTTSTSRGDGQRVRRTLGLVPDNAGGAPRQVIFYEAAEALCHALYADPTAVGV